MLTEMRIDGGEGSWREKQQLARTKARRENGMNDISIECKSKTKSSPEPTAALQELLERDRITIGILLLHHVLHLDHLGSHHLHLVLRLRKSSSLEAEEARLVSRRRESCKDLERFLHAIISEEGRRARGETYWSRWE